MMIAISLVSLFAAILATVNGILGMRHRKYDDVRFARVHEEISGEDREGRS
jgi:hypothetical protein